MRWRGGLTTAEILYRRPDRQWLLQSYVWQNYDMFPKFPVLCDFLAFWEKQLDGPLVSVTVAHSRLIKPAELRAVDGVSFDVAPGEVLGIVGESGSGKSVSSMAVMGLLPKSARISGSVSFRGEDVLSMGSRRRNEVRGNKVAMLFQQPKVMLDPTARVGSQVAEALRQHRKVGRREAKARVVEMLREQLREQKAPPTVRWRTPPIRRQIPTAARGTPPRRRPHLMTASPPRTSTSTRAWRTRSCTSPRSTPS